MIWGQELAIEPLITGETRLQMFLNQRKVILTVKQQQVGNGKSSDQFHWIVRATREVLDQLLTLRWCSKIA